MSKAQLKSPQSFQKMSENYGPGFVALSQRSGRVLASGRDVQSVWKKIKNSKLFKENQVVIRHVPPPGAALIYCPRTRRHFG